MVSPVFILLDTILIAHSYNDHNLKKKQAEI